MASMTQDNPVSISAQELHEILLTAHSAGNLARRQFIDTLRSLHETKLFAALGFSSIVAYADGVFHYGRSQTLDFLRVSRALGKLPQIARAFERGEICFSLLSELTQVASPASETEWLELVGKESRAAIHLHLEYAKDKKTDRPRRGGYGLPGRPVKLSFELSPDEYAVVTAGLDKIAREMGASLDGEVPDPKTALLYLLHRILATDPAESITAGRQERERSPFAVVYHRCPSCHEAAVETEAGRVEVAASAIDRVEPSAERVPVEPESEPELPGPERDHPNTPRMRFFIRTRDAGRCSNPHCRRLVGAGGHCHHLEFLSAGGRTQMMNETLVCPACHANIHAGALAIEGNPGTGLCWKVVCADLTRSVRENLERLVQQASVRVLEVAAASGIPDDVMATACQALEVLGCSARQARDETREAWKRLLGAGNDRDTISAETLIRETCRRC